MRLPLGVRPTGPLFLEVVLSISQRNLAPHQNFTAVLWNYTDQTVDVRKVLQARVLNFRVYFAPEKGGKFVPLRSGVGWPGGYDPREICSDPLPPGDDRNYILDFDAGPTAGLPLLRQPGRVRMKVRLEAEPSGRFVESQTVVIELRPPDDAR